MAEVGNEQPGNPADRLPAATDVEQTIRRAKGGERDCLEALAAQCRGYLLAIAHGELDETLRAKVAVSDVVQETLMRAQEKLPEFRGVGGKRMQKENVVLSRNSAELSFMGFWEVLRNIR